MRAKLATVMRGILLIDHGSRRSDANSQLHELAARLEQSLSAAGEPSIVECAHMELAEPNVFAGFSSCVRRGATHIVAVPCMLSRGRHVTEDIPALLGTAARAHPGVTFGLSAPLAEQPGFIELLRQASESLASRSSR